MGRTWQGQAGDDRQASPAGAEGASPPGRSGIGVSLCSRVTRGLRGTAAGRRRRTRRDRRRAAGRASAPPRRAAGLLTAGRGSSGVPVTAAVPGTRLPRTHLYGRDCVSQAPGSPASPRLRPVAGPGGRREVEGGRASALLLTFLRLPRPLAEASSSPGPRPPTWKPSVPDPSSWAPPGCGSGDAASRRPSTPDPEPPPAVVTAGQAPPQPLASQRLC